MFIEVGMNNGDQCQWSPKEIFLKKEVIIIDMA
jgi:hypothetical protein